MPLTGDVKREYQRIYMRGKRNKNIQRAAITVSRVLKPRPGAPLKLTPEQEDTARAALALALRSNGISVDRVVGKVAERIDSKRRYLVAGKAIIAEDNNAQLRAIDIAIKLQERAGMLPVEHDGHSGAAQIVVKMLIMSDDGHERLALSAGGNSRSDPETEIEKF